MSLHEAATKGDTQAIMRLLENGTNINAKDEYGDTPLHEAARRGQYEAAKLLVSRGADLFAKNDMGKIPLDNAVFFGGESNVGRLLLKKIIEVKLAKEEDLRNPQASGKTWLHYAAWVGDMGIVEFLISKKLDIHLKDAGKDTLLHYAGRSDNKEIEEVIAYLLKNGLDINARNTNGETPLHYAVGTGGFQAMKTLVEKGADIEAKDYCCGITPLQDAVDSGKG